LATDQVTDLTEEDTAEDTAEDMALTEEGMAQVMAEATVFIYWIYNSSMKLIYSVI
jgi:hypothetical protein